MLTRLYINNYKACAGLTYEPGQHELILGDNGSGKSSVFEVLNGLRALIIDGRVIDDIFPQSTATRWLNLSSREIHLTIHTQGFLYQYILNFIYDIKEKQMKINSEKLYRNDIEDTKNESSVLYPINITMVSSCEGRTLYTITDDDTEQWFLVSQTTSSLHLLLQRDDPRLADFYDWLRNLQCVRLNPYAIDPESGREAEHLSVTGENFVSWYRHLVQENPGISAVVSEYLKELIPGFQAMSLQKEGQHTRVLKVLISSEGKSESYSLDELSEGQRALIVLHTLLAVMRERPGLLCLDEPDNFVSLKEIQPWLMELDTLTDDENNQVLLISHHPEVIDYFAPNEAVRFVRPAGGPVQVERFAVSEENQGLRPSEIVARGWEDE